MQFVAMILKVFEVEVFVIEGLKNEKFVVETLEVEFTVFSGCK